MIRKLYVVHHSHTDIGYTHGQGRILHWHDQYIRQAMDFAQQRDDFVWTCETFYPVEHFWRNSNPADRKRFARLTAQGQLGLNAGYFHFTELPDAPLLSSLTRRVRKFSDEQKIPLTAAMFADVNGLPLAYARVLAGLGVSFILTCVHPHHGHVPFDRRQWLFRWELGDGQSLLVCHSDHYMIGNELGLTPGGEINYMAGFTDTPKPHDDDVLERRLPAYLRRMEAAGWPHDFLVIAVSGLAVDNAPPSLAIADRIARWNQHHAQDVKIELTTPTRLAGLAPQAREIPTYSGDWPDWWADGVASDPQAVALFRDAQRQRAAGSPPLRQHNHKPPPPSSPSTMPWPSSPNTPSATAPSVSHPWQLLAQQLRLKKLSFAADAADQAEILFDRVTEPLGAGPLAYDRPPCFMLLNPFDHSIRGLAELEIEAPKYYAGT